MLRGQFEVCRLQGLSDSNSTQLKEVLRTTQANGAQQSAAVLSSLRIASVGASIKIGCWEFEKLDIAYHQHRERRASLCPHDLNRSSSIL